MSNKLGRHVVPFDVTRHIYSTYSFLVSLKFVCIMGKGRYVRSSKEMSWMSGLLSLSIPVTKGRKFFFLIVFKVIGIVSLESGCQN